MNFQHVIESLNIVLGLISNVMLIYLCVRFSKKNLGSYKYLLIIFASYDLYLTVLHAIVDPKIFNFDRLFTMYSASFPTLPWPTIIYVSCFTVPFALTNVNFLHRYWAVKKPINLTLFARPSFAFLLAMYPFAQGATWTTLALCADNDDSHYVEQRYFETYNLTVSGFKVMHHWKDGQVNVRASLILLGAVIVMCIQFAIAIFLATQTIAQIRKAKTFTSNFRALQTKILQALFAQASVPVFLVYTPFGCVILFPFFGIPDVFHMADLCMTITSCFPAFDAIVVILLIKDYRDGLLSLFCRRQESSWMGATTVWHSHIANTVSMRLD
ncbi:str-163 [Pristionchus pacificus]|uniref:Str-163 protein n=1 Tax=Pristionchus pacificus TaxID=54126 RepID=A0A2A6CL06_PRIPA|nr:str-163 [Pristionchus pacificus]|eukprot:PDM78733.1 str-163 protein [Pristionchus pacificus]